ncbi:metal ABC transporter substrate-binding protein [Limoniibacter endophyticus]|uniref:Metal ABC transporter substrate-binding protein n=1 Tax=Limoniibacter endophyticus TaxID=1565040 RepID=A0A8J3GIV5_9HYPH|nr:metal ABC transporter substrate-binding protein [Limoniibacter endophyticus]GHC80033.1 metal ABC transporter substrate-binding protein [Limoniibacter endophyticus]
MKKTITRIAAISSLFMAATSSQALAAEKLNVVASFSILQDLAKNVGGDRVDVKSIVPVNGDAHVYQPRPADAATLGGAGLILVNGLEFEGFLTRLLETSGTKAPVKTVSDGIQTLKNEEHGSHAHEHDHGHSEGHGHDDHGHGHGHHHHGEFDPHAWQSVANVKVYIDNIAKALCEISEPDCAEFEENANAYQQKLDALDQEIKAQLSKIPAENRVVVTSHEAFGYFGRDYDIKFIGAEGVSTESEASAADIAKLVDQIKHDKAAALFVENITNPRMIEQLASETGLKPGGTLYSDALTDENGEAPTYLDLMRHNAKTIAAGFAKN